MVGHLQMVISIHKLIHLVFYQLAVNQTKWYKQEMHYVLPLSLTVAHCLGSWYCCSCTVIQYTVIHLDEIHLQTIEYGWADKTGTSV